MRLEYSTNNSGGSWWLNDADWLALEAAGWDIEWYEDREDRKMLDRMKPGQKQRFLGALAGGASKQVSTTNEANDAITEFERVTGQNVDDEGCNCCGRPHYFTLYDDDDNFVASFDSYPVEYERRYF